MILAVAVAAFLAPLSGCLGQQDCVVPPPVKVLTLPVPMSYLATDPGQAWDTLALAWPPAGGAPATTQYRVDAGWNVSVDHYATAASGPSSAPMLESLHVRPGAGNVTLSRTWSLAREDASGASTCRSGRSGTLRWDLKAPVQGDLAAPGLGVRVMTAGFWENGTLFYTNIKQLDQSDWPRAGWYQWSGGDPLTVYVYDKDRSEESPIWRATTAGTAAGPLTGDAGAWDYGTTIPGFNEALKGLSTSTARVVHIAPDQAYTRAGNEAHPLYGAALVFYIKLVAVEQVPCPNVPMLCAMSPSEAGPASIGLGASGPAP